MELFDLLSPVETYLADKASLLYQPIGGTMELTPLCNMDCRMCYIHQTREEMERNGRMLTVEEWLRIAREMKESGVLFLLLTGGEPLVYPGFEQLYRALTDMGFVITVNTNGTLLNGHWLDLFAERPCRRLNITLYGTDDGTYGSLCNYPGGFTKLMKNVQGLKERNIPFRFNGSITPNNAGQLRELYRIAADCGTVLEANCHMMPPDRKEGADTSCFTRLSPEDAGRARVEAFFLKNAGADRQLAAINSLHRLETPAADTRPLSGLTCRAGRSGFWVTWRGELLPCGLFHEPSVDLKEHSFAEAWEELAKATAKLHPCRECAECKLKNICVTCAASCLTETGSIDRKPEYLCRMTQTVYEELKRIAES